MPSRLASPPPARNPAPQPPADKASCPPNPKQPIKTLRFGRIKAAVWENTGESGPFFNVTFSRSYLDDAKNWRDSDSFGRDDLPLLAKLADQAHTFIFEHQAQSRAT